MGDQVRARMIQFPWRVAAGALAILQQSAVAPTTADDYEQRLDKFISYCVFSEREYRPDRYELEQALLLFLDRFFQWKRLLGAGTKVLAAVGHRVSPGAATIAGDPRTRTQVLQCS